MTTTTTEERTLRGMTDDRASVRLRATMAAGSTPHPRYVAVLVERCAVEPEFFVRDMLTWALTRHPVSLTLPRVLDELGSPHAQARSQALHTLTKLGERSVWPAITPSLLTDPDDEVARTAWRAAALLTPEESHPDLAALLTTQLARGTRETRRSLSRALVSLGPLIVPYLHKAKTSPEPPVRAHAEATEHLLHNPEAEFEHHIAK
ncbi:HEAT repeat domain-containing protein [Streptomyces sp. Da 82-17]|uniref:HEAT repeat domain-containing protein n=1 Tax=Streptomyces sp. Da 82-17 TaxID=3377116 RepID=UPI0038D38B46